MSKADAKPNVKQLSLENVGPIKSADIKLGDLTILIGPQATGKTVFLQTLKLLEDIRYIVHNFKANDWYVEKDFKTFLQLYYGEGMDCLFSDSSKFRVNNKSIDFQKYVMTNYQKKDLNTLYIPAQRYTTLENGWPRSFNNYTDKPPYVMREFGDVVNSKLFPYRQKQIHLFPMEGKLNKEIRKGLESSIFEGSKLQIKKGIGNYNIVLSPSGSSNTIQLNAASAGQREFAPYLYSLYYLLPAGKQPKMPGVNTVIIEELEMGLHPKAIGDAFLTVLDLLSRGYRVVMSTHSPVMIDYVWALIEFQKSKGNKNAEEYLSKLFKINGGSLLTRIAPVLKKLIKLYYFNPTGDFSSSEVTDISSLDLFSEDDAVSSWGGLTAFSTHVGNVISELED